MQPLQRTSEVHRETARLPGPIAKVKSSAPRSAAAQRRATQAALATAAMALRSPERRRVGWRVPPGDHL